MAPTERPNILLYCTDQQRADLMGCMGHQAIHTPNLDALASRGVLLKNLFIQGPVCMPSRASILTGTYPSRHGVVDNGYNLSEHLPTMGELFANAGYHTGAVGRTHIRCSRPHPVHPPKNYYGFEDCVHSQCYWDGLDPHGEYLAWIRREHPELYDEAATTNTDRIGRKDAYNAGWTTLDDDKTMTAWVTDQSLSWIDRHQANRGKEPFLLWAGTWDPHARFLAPKPWDTLYPPREIPLPVRREREWESLAPHFAKKSLREWTNSDTSLDDVIRNSLSIYWGMISHIDDQFGRLMRGLHTRGVSENTIVVFLSDHGEMAGNHWVWAKGPYFYDDALRVPGIISWPAGIARRTCLDSLVETIDLLPTLAALADVPAGSTHQGRSFDAALRGTAATHRTDVFCEYHDHTVSGDRMFTLRDERCRITIYQGRRYGELFDLDGDPNALHNLWDDPSHAKLRQIMMDRLLQRIMANSEYADTREDLW